MAVAVHEPIYIPKVEPGHGARKPSQVDSCETGFSLGSASNATSKSRTSHTLRASIRFGPGIRPSRTSSSNLVAEIPMYIAASSRERPRRGMGRTQDSTAERVMATTLCLTEEGGWL